MGCQSSMVYTLFSFTEIQRVYQIIKLLSVQLKKWNEMQGRRNGCHSLTRFRDSCMLKKDCQIHVLVYLT